MKQYSLDAFLSKNNSQSSVNNTKSHKNKESKKNDINSKSSIHNNKDNNNTKNKMFIISKQKRIPSIEDDISNKSKGELASSESTVDKSLPFMTIIEVLIKIETCKGVNSKDAIKDLFATLFQKLIYSNPEDLSRCYYFLLSKVGPTYRSPEFGIGNGILEKIVGKVIGMSDKQIKEKMITFGDLALVASEGKKTVQTMDKFTNFISTKNTLIPLTIKDVLNCYKKTAEIKGKSSQDEKIKLICQLMFKANKDELKYIVRSLQKSLKIGASLKTILSSLARCIVNIYKSIKTYDEKDIYAKLLLSMNKLTDEDIVFNNIIQLIKSKDDFNKLPELCKITPGIPVNPQLARPTNGLPVIFKRFENIPFTCEYKYDGFRGQIHYYNNKTEVFSRNLENMTETYPDVVEYVESFIKESQKKNTNPTSSFIIDCEMVAYDRQNNKILPFQQLTTRTRKNVDISKITIHVCMFCFDILYLNDEDLTKLTLKQRREKLHNTFTESEYIQFAKNLTSENQTEIENFMNDSIVTGCEGLIIKAIDKNSEYMPGQRNFSWLKLKKDYLDSSIGDSLDLVVIGAQYGKGKRCGLYGSFLLACYNDDSETFESVTMTGAGLTDENLDKIYNELQPYLIDKPLSNYRIGNIEVDVFFKAYMVWEIKTADLTQSPIYVAGSNLTEDNRGISLRFPRFIRIRSDKKPEEACTSEYIVNLYKQQASIANNQVKDVLDDIDDLY